jgi:hypothetical protein
MRIRDPDDRPRPLKNERGRSTRNRHSVDAPVLGAARNRGAGAEKEARPTGTAPLSVVSETELVAKREKPAAPIVVVRDTLVGARSVVCRGQVIGISLSERAAQSPHVLSEEERRHTQRFNFSFARKYDHTASGRLTIHLDARSAGGRSSWPACSRSPSHTAYRRAAAGC